MANPRSHPYSPRTGESRTSRPWEEQAPLLPKYHFPQTAAVRRQGWITPQQPLQQGRDAFSGCSTNLAFALPPPSPHCASLEKASSCTVTSHPLPQPSLLPAE